MQSKIPVSLSWAVPCHLFLPALSTYCLVGLNEPFRKAFMAEALSFLLDQKPEMILELLQRVLRLGVRALKKPIQMWTFHT